MCSLPLSAAVPDSLPALVRIATPRSFVLRPEDSKDMAAFLPLPKWRNQRHSREGPGDDTNTPAPDSAPWTRRGGRGGRGERATTPAREQLSLRTQTAREEAPPRDCGCAATFRRASGRLRDPSGPASLFYCAGARRGGGAPALQTNASAAARRGVGPDRACARAPPPAVTAVARAERRSRGACAGWLCGRSR